MKKVCFILFCCCCLLSLLSKQQENNRRQELKHSYIQFQEVFEQNIKKYNHEDRLDDANLFHFLHPERLPEWLFFKLPESPDSIFLIAVSDPGMDAENGLKLALYRALIMYAFSGEFQLLNLREQYIKETEFDYSNAYSEYSQISFPLYIDINDIHVIKKHITRFDETIILASIPKKVAAKRFLSAPFYQLHAVFFTQAHWIDERNQVNEQFTLTIEDGDDASCIKYNYQVTRINQMVNLITIIHGSIVTDSSTSNLKYVSPSDKIPDQFSSLINQHGQSLRNGLWHALLTSFISEIAIEAYTGSTHFKQFEQLYNNMPISLERFLADAHIKSSIPVIYINNNKLYTSTYLDIILSE